jgi:hypothetical protein
MGAKTKKAIDSIYDHVYRMGGPYVIRILVHFAEVFGETIILNNP